jgi:hypothetical protein
MWALFVKQTFSEWKTRAFSSSSTNTSSSNAVPHAKNNSRLSLNSSTQKQLAPISKKSNNSNSGNTQHAAQRDEVEDDGLYQTV